MADYGVAVGALDVSIGRVLEAIARNGLEDDTLVIITTDHGISLPGMKSNHTDGGLGVMLMLRGPGGFEGAKRATRWSRRSTSSPPCATRWASSCLPGCRAARSHR